MRHSRQNLDSLINGVGEEYSGNRIRRILQLLAAQVGNVEETVNIITGGGSGGGGGGGGSTSTTEGSVYEWCANGPYEVDTNVDGKRVAPRTEIIRSVHLSRTTPGASGATVLDLLKDGTSIYTTVANRPQITASQTDSVLCSLPDAVNLPILSELTVHTVAKESGSPEGWVLQVVTEAI